MKLVFPEMDELEVGIIMKKLVWQAICVIRAQRRTFTAKEKTATGDKADYVTSADLAAQESYLEGLRKHFPQAGIVAEEENFKTKGEGRLWFSIDGIDGTRAFKRRQSHGVGTMLALADTNEIIGAYVGDIMTQEIYGFRPGDDEVHRISDGCHSEPLIIKADLPLHQQDMLFKEIAQFSSGWLRRPGKASLFKDVQVGGGGIGITCARLWKGEVGGLVLQPFNMAPWDAWPVVGISKKMGFVFLRPSPGGTLEQYEPTISAETYRQNHPTLIIHKCRLDELEAWQAP